MATAPRPVLAPIAAAQEFLTQEKIPGWLIYDYRQSNPIFRQVITPSGHVTRPCFLYVPPSASPTIKAFRFADELQAKLAALSARSSPRGSHCTNDR